MIFAKKITRSGLSSPNISTDNTEQTAPTAQITFSNANTDIHASNTDN